MVLCRRTLGESKARTSTARGSNDPIPNSNEEKPHKHEAIKRNEKEKKKK